ncbi:MAG: type I secretion system permease/ATPase [Reyranella sp.]|uniref:type I secretion system permease/ATPase n=1 Tax=Reyranella sp. TaxID=1929291 RepID=UPI002731973B|nr:type I secretion system permease/ATPase [Reyranella sp.]MDP1966043.1 type I secretion system permease/ATPase [Reyranella sp.]MDP2376923.1 type I secretion system permease/ATPase [Reyranella sp.]
MGAAPRTELATALAAARTSYIGVAVFTGILNILFLTGSFFMLQIYDRVLPSRSIPTLIGLCVLAFALYGFQAVLDIARNRVLIRIAGGVAETLDRRVYELIVKLPLRAPTMGGFEPVRDLDQIRSFMSGGGPAALFDLPWMPLYLGICYVFHPLLGLTATVGALILVAITVITEFKVRQPSIEVSALGSRRNSLAEMSRRNSEVLHAMGMVGRFAALWSDHGRHYLAAHQRVGDITGGLGGLSRALRMMLQSAVLAVGAYLVINQQATAGIIIAGSILASRALAPVELVIAQWRTFVAARQSWHRLNNLLIRLPVEEHPMVLPRPKNSLSVEQISVAPPGTNIVVVQDAAFELKAGQGLGIVGPSASGKSSLVRAIVGVWITVRGKVRIDGATLEQWSSEALGEHIGYLPQDMELFAGTIAQNIARLEPSPASEKVIAAARAAGVHEMILALPNGYETQMGEGGTALSAGQRQRIGLARALYGDPFLVVLDEPNSSLDQDGDEALTRAILGVRARGGIVVVVAHRPSAMAGVDQLLVMRNGRQHAFGPKDTVIKEAMKAAQQAQPGNPAAASVTAPGLVSVPAVLRGPNRGRETPT